MDAALEDPAVLRAMPESEWLEYVISEARAQGWLVHHDYDKREHNIGADPGFPDLCLARAGHVIFAELKRQARSNPADSALSRGNRWGGWGPKHTGLIHCREIALRGHREVSR